MKVRQTMMMTKSANATQPVGQAKKKPVTKKKKVTKAKSKMKKK